MLALNYVVNPDAAEAVADDIRAAGAEAIAIKADVSREDDVQAMFRQMLDQLGTIDILVNNAGLQKDAPFTEMTLAQWNTVIGVFASTTPRPAGCWTVWCRDQICLVRPCIDSSTRCS